MATQVSVNFWAQKATLTNLCWSVCSTLLLFHSLPFLVIVALCVRVSGHRQIDLDFVGFRWRFRRRLVVIRVRQSVCVAVVIIRFAENVPEGFLSVKAWNAVMHKMRNVTLVSGALNLAHDPKKTKIRKKRAKQTFSSQSQMPILVTSKKYCCYHTHALFWCNHQFQFTSSRSHTRTWEPWSCCWFQASGFWWEWPLCRPWPGPCGQDLSGRPSPPGWQ